MADQTKNSKNSESILFRRLTKLLSGPIVARRTQTGRRLRRIDLDKYSSRFRSASGKQFKKTAYDPFSNLQANVMANQHRAERYVDFDQMEYTPEVASALDIYADEMTTSSQLRPLLNIDCPNEEIKSVLSALFYNILNIEYNLFGWCRTMCKYGDFFLYLDIDEKRGIQSAIGLPTPEIERLEGEDKTNPNYTQFQWNTAGMTFENWQLGHFRILGNDKYAPYGSSVLEPARRIWRQLTLLEDAMMAYRIVRSPERRVFYVDVGNIPPDDVEQYMQKIMTQMKRHQVVDPDTGRVDLRYNPLSIDEDYFIPTRAGQNSRVESLPGGSYTGDIDDVKYLRDKLFSALKVPRSYLAQSDDAGEDKTTLAQKDIRFARTVQRLQRSVITELEKIGIIHLYVLGFRQDDLVSFKLALNNPSKIAEMQELEHWKTKFDVAGAATEGFFSRRWITKKLFGMTDEEFLRNQREMFYDRNFDAQLEAVGELVQAEASKDLPADTFEGEGEFGEPEGDDEGFGDIEGMEDEGGDEGDDVLPIQPPGSRWTQKEKDRKMGKRTFKDGSTTTSRSKGKRYEPVKSDSNSFGARQRSTKGSWNNEITKNTIRNTSKGASELSRLAKGSITEKKQTNYSEEEKRIMETNREVSMLIETLNLRSEKHETKAQ
mgnify:FL=1